MKIEPCPFCQVACKNTVSLRRCMSVGRMQWVVECANCHASGDPRTIGQDAIHSWNRLSRIVRAAEEYHRIRGLLLMSGNFSPDPSLVEAGRKVLRDIYDAVEGGTE